MKTKKFLIYGMLLLASFLLVITTSCEKDEDDDPTPPVENDNGNDNGNGDIEYGQMTDSRDGNTYKTVQIGNQVWMAENLAYLPEITFEDDWDIPTEPQYAVYGYAPGSGTETVSFAKATENYSNYGVLYNSTAAMTACPQGWHLPSDDEWTDLTDYVVSEGYPNETDSISGAGNALKSCLQVDSPLGDNCDPSNHPRWNSHDTHYGSDIFGFATLPGGYRNNVSGYFYRIGDIGYWWSATLTADVPWYRTMRYDGSYVYRSYTTTKGSGYSVRCVKD